MVVLVSFSFFHLLRSPKVTINQRALLGGSSGAYTNVYMLDSLPVPYRNNSQVFFWTLGGTSNIHKDQADFMHTDHLLDSNPPLSCC